jgi:hypothetical protein
MPGAGVHGPILAAAGSARARECESVRVKECKNVSVQDCEGGRESVSVHSQQSNCESGRV